MNNDSFFSIDRLVEFGLGMSMAQQMMNVMNESMKNMYVPGSIQTMPSSRPVATCYVAIDGKSVGPLSESEFSQMVMNNADLAAGGKNSGLVENRGSHATAITLQ